MSLLETGVTQRTDIDRQRGSSVGHPIDRYFDQLTHGGVSTHGWSLDAVGVTRYLGDEGLALPSSIRQFPRIESLYLTLIADQPRVEQSRAGILRRKTTREIEGRRKILVEASEHKDDISTNPEGYFEMSLIPTPVVWEDVDDYASDEEPDPQERTPTAEDIKFVEALLRYQITTESTR